MKPEPSPSPRTDPTVAASPPESATQPLSPNFGKFLRERKLGAGGMGEVWKAWDTQLNRWVALKFLKGGDDDEVARFLREAQLAGQLSHPNIAAVHEVGESQGRRFIAMQFVDGQTFRTVPRSDRRHLVRLLRDAALAVHAAHQQGVIHRDLKPDNLMVTTAGHVYVMDFGLARSVQGAQSVSGTVVGTPVYMPPEQARGETVDARADVYALGATLYELLSDRPPFKGGAIFDILLKVQEEEPASLQRIDPSIDPDLETIAARAMEKDRDRRYATADELAADLSRWLEGEPIAARPASLAYRLRKRLAKRKAVVALSVVALLAVAAGLTVGVLQHLRRQELELKVYPLVERARELVRAADRMLFRESPPEEERERKLAEAERLCREAMGLHGGYAPAHLVLGLVQLQRDRPDDAITAFSDAIERNPGYHQAYLERAKSWAEKVFDLEHAAGTVLADADTLAKEKEWISRAAGDLSRAGAPDTEERVLSELLGLMLAGDSARLREKALEALEKGEVDERAWRIVGESEHRLRAFTSAMAAYARYAEVRRGDARGWWRLAHMYRDGMRFDEAAAAAERALKLRSTFWRASFERGVANFHKASQSDNDPAAADRLYAAAFADFDRTVAASPASVEALNYRGLARRNEPEKSIADFDRALAIRPGAFEVLANRGSARRKLGQLDASLADLDRAMALSPGYSEGLVNRGWTRYSRGEWAAALEDFRGVLAKAADNLLALEGLAMAREKQGDLKGALADFDRAIAAHPQSARTHVNRGGARLAAGDREGAMKDYDRALALRADYPDALYNRAIVKRDAGDAAGAMSDFDRAVALQPRMVEALVERGVARKQAGNRDGARADYESALAIEPAHVEAMINLGVLEFERGLTDAALEWFERALRLRPDSAAALFNRGNARVARRDYRAALQDYDAALQRQPDLFDVLGSRAVVRRILGDLPGAIADCDRAIRLKASDPRIHQVRGLARLESGDPRGAIADFDIVVALTPRAAEPFYSRANAKKRIGEVRAAIEDYDRAIALEPGHAEAHTNRANARRSLGDLDGAIADYEKALSVAPKDWRYRQMTQGHLDDARREKAGK